RGRVTATQAVLDTVRDQQAAAETAARAAAAAVLTAESAHGHSLVEWERRQGAAAALCARVSEDLGFTAAAEVLTEAVPPAGDGPTVQSAFAGTAQPDPWTAWRTHWEAEPSPEPSNSVTQNAERSTQNAITALRSRLRRMGPINPLAIDEYAAAQARHGFLSSQLADLHAAADSLRQVAAELDRLMRERLATTFAAVAAAFHETFPRLFGGGAARLELTDPADLATTGIEIIAQPPGKRAQALNSLSGGERALTSVALLFAILHVRPTPFCIMDEVDAALDEANIGRFRNELAALSARSQFILITHNRATIEAAGAIYGVSLGTDTASRILSLRLEELPAAA
ncbi:MAG: chromosome segregation protein SMC, partial [Chloroflexota bacterium]|nr:chromosome segregation protein SMC [Chloroflexota bacterium]